MHRAQRRRNISLLGRGDCRACGTKSLRRLQRSLFGGNFGQKPSEKESDDDDQRTAPPAQQLAIHPRSSWTATTAGCDCRFVRAGCFLGQVTSEAPVGCCNRTLTMRAFDAAGTWHRAARKNQHTQKPKKNCNDGLGAGNPTDQLRIPPLMRTVPMSARVS